MSLKSLLRVTMICAVAVSATAASAQDWWNPGSWLSPKPYYGNSTRSGGYGSPCANGVCRPSYGTSYYHGKGNPGWSGYRPPLYEPVAPSYRPDRSDRYGDYEAYHVSPRSSRSRYSPFYE